MLGPHHIAPHSYGGRITTLRVLAQASTTVNHSAWVHQTRAHAPDPAQARQTSPGIAFPARARERFVGSQPYSSGHPDLYLGLNFEIKLCLGQRCNSSSCCMVTNQSGRSSGARSEALSPTFFTAVCNLSPQMTLSLTLDAATAVGLDRKALVPAKYLAPPQSVGMVHMGVAFGSGCHNHAGTTRVDS